MKNIAIFASGTGSNAEKIIEYFEGHPEISVKIIVSNKKNAGVLKVGEKFAVESILINKEDFYDSEKILETFEDYDVDFIVLAGFLWLVPSYLIRQYPNRIVNIHPALLPAYGGKGMYGHHIHQAVFDNKELESGITIHYVNEAYDEGAVIFQKSMDISQEDSPEAIAKKVLALEHKYFSRIVEKVLQEKEKLFF